MTYLMRSAAALMSSSVTALPFSSFDIFSYQGMVVSRVHESSLFGAIYRRAFTVDIAWPHGLASQHRHYESSTS